MRYARPIELLFRRHLSASRVPRIRQRPGTTRKRQNEIPQPKRVSSRIGKCMPSIAVVYFAGDCNPPGRVGGHPGGRYAPRKRARGQRQGGEGRASRPRHEHHGQQPCHEGRSGAPRPEGSSRKPLQPFFDFVCGSG